MSSRISAYAQRLQRGNDGDQNFEEMFLDIFRDMDARLAVAESRVASVVEMQQTLLNYGQAIIDQTINPLIEQILASADLGTVFTAHSVSSVDLETTSVTFVILPDERIKFAPAAMLTAVDEDNPSRVMYGRKTSYDRSTGELQVEVLSVNGTGIVSSWVITAGSLVSTASLVAVKPSVATPANNLQLALEQIAYALGDNPEFAIDVMDALADRYTVAEVDELLSAKATPGQISTAISALGLKSASQKLAQTGQDDATTGALLAVGAFGLGLPSLVTTPMRVNDLNTCVAAGFYSGDSTGTSNGPVSNFAGVFIVLPHSPTRCAQIAVNTNGDLYVRAKNSSTWAAWRQATLT